MNLRQLQFVREIARNGLSISKAAKLLNTSQPGVSQQLQALEQELGLTIFTRDRNRLTGITPRGQGVLEHAEAALFNVDCIHSIAKAVERRGHSQLSIATSHTQARYLLPPALKRFSELHPATNLTVRHEPQSRLGELILLGEIDLAITTATAERERDEVIMLPCYESRRVIVVPPHHELLRKRSITLRDLAQYDLITYHESIPTRRLIMETFARSGTVPNVRLSAIDADVIKAYVAQGLGITILPEMTVDTRLNPDLRVIQKPILFPPSITSVMVNRHRPIKAQTIDFIRVFCPTLALPAAITTAHR